VQVDGPSGDLVTFVLVARDEGPGPDLTRGDGMAGGMPTTASKFSQFGRGARLEEKEESNGR